MSDEKTPYVTRAGEKLAFALDHFGVDPAGLAVADLGSHQGGFVDCLLRRGAARVYSVDTSYGTLAWKLRNDERVVVMERQNALHVDLDRKVDGVTIDVGWTRQDKILPAAERLLAPGRGWVLSLLKPQYEADKDALERGVVSDAVCDQVLERIVAWVRERGMPLRGWARSPLRGGKGNPELFLYLDWSERSEELTG